MSPPLWVYFFEKMLPTGEMLKMQKFKGLTHKKCVKNWGNVKNDKSFNISPVLGTFFVGRPFKFLHF